MVMFNHNMDRAKGASPRKINCSSGSGGDKDVLADPLKPVAALEAKLSGYPDAKDT